MTTKLPVAIYPSFGSAINYNKSEDQIPFGMNYDFQYLRLQVNTDLRTINEYMLLDPDNFFSVSGMRQIPLRNKRDGFYFNKFFISGLRKYVASRPPRQPKSKRRRSISRWD